MSRPCFRTDAAAAFEQEPGPTLEDLIWKLDDLRDIVDGQEPQLTTKEWLLDQIDNLIQLAKEIPL